MKLVVLALDFDGTLASNGELDRGAQLALQEARRKGLITVLVTGRILADLARQTAHFELFDAIVAENGAVLHFPRTGRSTLLAEPAHPGLAQELTRRGIEFTAGECVVELDASHALAVQGIVRERELPLILAFNRARLMVLPQAVSKGTGLREAARALRVSLHNALCIGDAENDHELLRACEYGIAVAWGSAPLQAAADEVLAGAGPPAVAERLLAVMGKEDLPRPQRERRRLTIGTRADGTPLALETLDRSVLIAGDAGSGKSWLAGLLCEQLILQRYCVCVIDPEGDYVPLESLPGVLVLASDERAPEFSVIEHVLRFPDVSVVIDLASMPLEAKRRYVPELLERLGAMRSRTGLPQRIVLDEAHYFIGPGRAERLLGAAATGYALVTFRVSELDPALLASTSAVLVSHESDPEEVELLRQRFGPRWDEQAWARLLAGLELDQAALLPAGHEGGGEIVSFRLARRLTRHVRHRHKYAAMQVRKERAFVFRRDGMETGACARSLSEMAALLSLAPDQVYEQHLRHGDFSRWIRDVFRDQVLADEVLEIESAWRHRGISRPHDRIVRAIERRYADREDSEVEAGRGSGPLTAPCSLDD